MWRRVFPAEVISRHHISASEISILNPGMDSTGESQRRDQYCAGIFPILPTLRQSGKSARYLIDSCHTNPAPAHTRQLKDFCTGNLDGTQPVMIRGKSAKCAAVGFTGWPIASFPFLYGRGSNGRWMDMTLISHYILSPPPWPSAINWERIIGFSEVIGQTGYPRLNGGSHHFTYINQRNACARQTPLSRVVTVKNTTRSPSLLFSRLMTLAWAKPSLTTWSRLACPHELPHIISIWDHVIPIDLQCWLLHENSSIKFLLKVSGD